MRGMIFQDRNSLKIKVRSTSKEGYRTNRSEMNGIEKGGKGWEKKREEREEVFE